MFNTCEVGVCGMCNRVYSMCRVWFMLCKGSVGVYDFWSMYLGYIK